MKCIVAKCKLQCRRVNNETARSAPSLENT